MFYLFNIKFISYVNQPAENTHSDQFPLSSAQEGCCLHWEFLLLQADLVRNSTIKIYELSAYKKTSKF